MGTYGQTKNGIAGLLMREAAAVVRRIFAMTMDGHGLYQIAQQLTTDKVEIPAVHLARHGEGVNKDKTFKDIYSWGSSTIVNLRR